MSIRNPKLMAGSVFMLLIGGFILYVYLKLGNGISIGYYSEDLVRGLALFVSMILIVFSFIGIIVALIAEPPR